MARHARSSWVAALAVAGVCSCKPGAAPPAASAPDSVLSSALYAQGGLAKLKRGSAFSARFEGTLQGLAISGTIKQKAGAVRLEYVDATSKNPVVQVEAPDGCWQKIGRAVVPCHPKLAAHSTRLAKLLEASWLFPLQEGRYKHKVVPAQLGGKTCHGITVDDAGTPLGTVLVDQSTSLVVGVKMQTELGGKTGELVGSFSDVETSCGVQIATTRELTFLGAPLARWKIAGLICQAPPDKAFEKPAQVAHGLVEIRHTFDAPLACTKLNGPLSGVSGALDKLVAYLAQKSLAPEGPARLIHRKGPPLVKQPSSYVTDVCVPVSKKAWVMPKEAWKGEFFLDEIVGDEGLAAFGVGDLEKTTPELAAALLAEAKKKGRKQAGSMIQTLYMRAEDFPAEQRVSELHLPLD